MATCSDGPTDQSPADLCTRSGTPEKLCIMVKWARVASASSAQVSKNRNWATALNFPKNKNITIVFSPLRPRLTPGISYKTMHHDCLRRTHKVVWFLCHHQKHHSCKMNEWPGCSEDLSSPLIGS